MKIIISMNPVAASRPRVGRWGTFYLEPYKSWKKEAVHEVDNALPDGHVPIDHPMVVDLKVFVEPPGSSKLMFPKPDVDNYAKAVLDACNAQVWKDDSLIQKLTIEKAWGNGAGWIEMEITEWKPAPLYIKLLKALGFPTEWLRAST